MSFRAQPFPQCHFERSEAESRNLVAVRYQPHPEATGCDEIAPIRWEYTIDAKYRILRVLNPGTGIKPLLKEIFLEFS